MRTVLLIGAGITRAAGARNSLKRLPPLDADFFNIARAVDRELYESVVSDLEYFVGDYSEELISSLETATTYLYLKALDSKKGDMHHLAFLDLLSLLNLVLAETTNILKPGKRSLIYRFILSELTQAETPERLSVITFNYDIFLERVLLDIELAHPNTFHFPGCYRLRSLHESNVVGVDGRPNFPDIEMNPKGVGIFKLHGSLNWHSKHTSNKPTPYAITSQKRELHVMDSPFLSESLSWRRKRRTVYMKPIIVPPVSGKRGVMHEDILPLWAMAGRTLRDADRIVIAGYSCPPFDLEARTLISENLRQNPDKRVYVIDPNAETASRFVKLCGVDHVTIYSSLEDWIRDARF